MNDFFVKFEGHIKPESSFSLASDRHSFLFFCRENIGDKIRKIIRILISTKVGLIQLGNTVFRMPGSVAS